MIASLTLRSLCSPDKLSRSDALQVLEAARELERLAAAGTPHKPLRGKHLALLCAPGATHLGDDFTAAAVAAGAKVTRICPQETGMTLPQGLSRTAMLLGRLYDAIDCEGLGPEFARTLAAEAGVPVYDGLAEHAHSLAGQRPELASPAPLAGPACTLGLPGSAPLAGTGDLRPFLMQAVLANTIV